MDKITDRAQAVLDVLDEQIAQLEKKLEKIQPFIEELNRLRQTKRVLLSEKGVTGGGGNPRTRLSQEEVILWLRNNGPAKPGAIAEGLGVPGGTVRSHLARFKDQTYESNGGGEWSLIDGG